jgi:esterase/lipase
MGMRPMSDSIPKAATASKSTGLHHAFFKELILGQNPDGSISNCKTLINAIQPGYVDVTAPFLIFAGEEDKSAPLDGCRTILSKISSSYRSLKMMDGVGHWHCIEASEEVGRAISKFSSSTKRFNDFAYYLDY